MNVLRDHPEGDVRIDGKTSDNNAELINTPGTTPNPNPKPVTSGDVVIGDPMYVYLIEVKEMLIDETSIMAEIIHIILEKELRDIRLAERTRLADRYISFRQLKNNVYIDKNKINNNKPGQIVKREKEMMEKSAVLDVNHEKNRILYRTEIEQAPSIEFTALNASIVKFELDKKVQGQLCDFLELHEDIFMIHKANKDWLKCSVC